MKIQCPSCRFERDVPDSSLRPGKTYKVTCPHCNHDFPSNDFGAYYASGLDERGYFHEELADKSLLVNTTFSDKPADWGVDDGHGWLTGDKDSGGIGASAG